MLMRDNSIITGVRHFSPEMRITMSKIYGDGYHTQVNTQGFVDQYGVFYDRETAWKIASRMGQIRRPTGSYKFDSEKSNNDCLPSKGVLFSENLY